MHVSMLLKCISTKIISTSFCVSLVRCNHIWYWVIGSNLSNATLIRARLLASIRGVFGYEYSAACVRLAKALYAMSIFIKYSFVMLYVPFVTWQLTGLIAP